MNLKPGPKWRQLLPPANTYGWNVLKSFASLGDDPNLHAWGTRLVKLNHPPLRLHSGIPWRKSIEMEEGGAILVYVAAQGAVDENGPYLLFNDARGADVRGRLPLNDLLDQLSRLPSGRKKILVLDCTAMTAQWSLGILRNDFARTLRSVEPRIEAIPNLVVISASAPDERSWTCGGWRQSVFGHYVLEGLKGNGCDTDHGGRIDLWDLYEGVREDTDSWVQTNRAARQTPMLLPGNATGYARARSIDLVPVARHSRSPEPKPAAEFEIPDEIVGAWDVHERLAAQVPGPAAHSRIAWRRFRDLLLRYEELVLADNLVDAANAHRRMIECQMEIERGFASGLSSVRNSRGMYAALCGEPAAGQNAGDSDTNVQEALESLWSAAPADRANQWDKLRGSDGNDSVATQRLRMALHQLIVQRASEVPAENHETASELIRLLADPFHPRPAESHFLVRNRCVGPRSSTRKRRPAARSSRLRARRTRRPWPTCRTSPS